MSEPTCRQSVRRRSIAATAVVLALVLSGCRFPFGHSPAPRPEAGEASPLRPSPQPPAASPLESPDFSPLQASVEQLLAGKSGTYGIYVEDLPTGMRFGLNPDREFVAASTIKVPLVLFLYRQAQAAQLDLEASLAIQPEDYEAGTGYLQYQPVGSGYTLRQLARLALVDSDNVATRMIMRQVGRENFRAYVRSLGTFIPPDRENVTSPRDLAAFFKAFLDFKKEAPDLAGEILDALLTTDFSDRLPALLPPDVPVAHKIGNQVRVVNDAGLVFLSRHPYVISILTDDVNEGEATETIAQISKLVYDYQAGLR